MKLIKNISLLIGIFFCFNCFGSWVECNSPEGKCKVSFPSAPTHAKKLLSVSDTDNVAYDVYLSSADQKNFYLMMIATYPQAIPENMHMVALEGFVKGILSNRKDGKLVDAKLIEVKGSKGIQFFVEGEDRYFKGMTLVGEKNLYLIGVEAMPMFFNEEECSSFIESFDFVD